MIVRLAFRNMIEDGLNSKILSNLRPTYEMALTITYVMRQGSFILRRAMSNDDVGLILVTLVYVDALLNRDPANAFAMAFGPPSIRCKRIRGAIRRDLLAKDATNLREANQDIRPSVRATRRAANRLRIMILRRSGLTRRFKALEGFMGLLSGALANAVDKIDLANMGRLRKVIKVISGLDRAIRINRRRIYALMDNGAATGAGRRHVKIGLIRRESSA